MKALVTGGSGFIGSHLVDRLLADGYETVVLDNFSSGQPSNLSQARNDPKLTLVDCDIDSDPIATHMRDIDVVFHVAAFADLRASLADHRADVRTNVLGGLRVLEAMADAGVKNLVYTSTSSLYGEASIVPTPENYAPTQTSLYGASKLAMEAFSEAYVSMSNFQLWTFRLSNVIGERCRRGIIWDFIKKLKANPQELEILGDGHQSKEFLYVKDCVDGILLGYLRGKDPVNKFNLATDYNLTPNDVADIVIDELHLPKVVRRYTGGHSGWIGDNSVVRLSSDRIRKFGWSPKVSSEEAIRRMVRWIISQGS